mmetsp:Transcript_9970/g.26414  ORF Transcript_9970/g.26414 Transcript_9970/m.26414 type:complete len:218 (-) Transcript_9970:1184-1837(-)
MVPATLQQATHSAALGQVLHSILVGVEALAAALPQAIPSLLPGPMVTEDVVLEDVSKAAGIPRPPHVLLRLPRHGQVPKVLEKRGRQVPKVPEKRGHQVAARVMADGLAKGAEVVAVLGPAAVVAAACGTGEALGAGLAAAVVAAVAVAVAVAAAAVLGLRLVPWGNPTVWDQAMHKLATSVASILKVAGRLTPSSSVNSVRCQRQKVATWQSSCAS